MILIILQTTRGFRDNFLNDWTKGIFGNFEWDRKWEGRRKLRIWDMSLFLVERFRLLIQMKSILLFYFQ